MWLIQEPKQTLASLHWIYGYFIQRVLLCTLYCEEEIKYFILGTWINSFEQFKYSSRVFRKIFSKFLLSWTGSSKNTRCLYTLPKIVYSGLISESSKQEDLRPVGSSKYCRCFDSNGLFGTGRQKPWSKHQAFSCESLQPIFLLFLLRAFIVIAVMCQMKQRPEYLATDC